MSHPLGRFLISFIIISAFFFAAPIFAGVFDVNLDPSFGDSGIVETDPGGAANASDLLIQSDGKMVATGFFDEDPDNTGGIQFVLVRYNSDGSLDDTFGNGGVFISNIARESESVAVAQRPDGKYIVGGRIDNLADGSFAGFLFLQVLADGSGVDNTFGSPIVFGDSAMKNSSFSTPGGTILNFMEPVIAFDMVLQSDGKALLAGSLDNDPDDFFDAFALGRINEDGSPDTGFGTDGMVVEQLIPGGIQEGRSVGLQNGSIIVGGDHQEGANDPFNFAVARLNGSDGSLDTSFGNDGYTIIDSGGDDAAEALAIQSDNKIVLAGFSASSPQDPTLLRLNPNGDSDNSFGVDGLSILNIGGDTNTGARALLLQPDGKMLIAGGTGSPENILVPQSFFIARVNTDGSLDSGFGNNGSVETQVANFSGASSLALQSDGKPVAAGFSAPVEAFTLADRFAILRYLVTPAGDDDDDDDGGGGCTLSKSSASPHSLVGLLGIMGLLAGLIYRQFFLRVK